MEKKIVKKNVKMIVRKKNKLTAMLMKMKKMKQKKKEGDCDKEKC